MDGKANILDGFRSWKIVLPVVIGLGATAWMFASEYTPESFSFFSFSMQSLLWFAVSFAMMLCRDAGYMLRIRILTDGELGWRRAFNVIMLWEFTSAVTPSAVGGTSVAIFFVHSEGFSLGRSTGIVMVTSFLDELFFALVFPLVLLCIGFTDLFGADSAVASSFVYFALLGYFIKLAYIIVLSYGLFVNPRGLKWLLLFIFRLPLIRRWRVKANDLGSDLVQTSLYFRHWPLRKWLRAFAATAVSWTARYWVVNTLVVAFFGLQCWSLHEHLVVFGKQLVMWVMMLVSPTPGGSGFAEYVFKEFLAGFIPAGTGVALALCWRLVSYYPYLILGAFVAPRWVRRLTSKRKSNAKEQ